MRLLTNTAILSQLLSSDSRSTMLISTIFAPRASHPREIQQPLLPFPLQTYPPIAFPLQTLPRHVAVRLDILDQTLLTHVVVLGPDEAQNQQVERYAVEVGGE